MKEKVYAYGVYSTYGNQPTIISDDQFCRNQLGNFARINYSGSCECDSGFTIENGKCTDGNLSCHSKLGWSSTYNSSSDTCECSYGYERGKDSFGKTQCISKDQVCKNQLGNNSSSDYLGNCACNSGYTIENGKCTYGVSYCSTKYGFYSKFNASNGSCECLAGYKMGKDSTFGTIQCVSEDKACKNQYGYLARSDSYGNCGCAEGLVIKNGSCAELTQTIKNVPVSQKPVVTPDQTCKNKYGSASNFTGTYNDKGEYICDCKGVVGYKLNDARNQCIVDLNINKPISNKVPVEIKTPAVVSTAQKNDKTISLGQQRIDKTIENRPTKISIYSYNNGSKGGLLSEVFLDTSKVQNIVVPTNNVLIEWNGINDKSFIVDTKVRFKEGRGSISEKCFTEEAQYNWDKWITCDSEYISSNNNNIVATDLGVGKTYNFEMELVRIGSKGEYSIGDGFHIFSLVPIKKIVNNVIPNLARIAIPMSETKLVPEISILKETETTNTNNTTSETVKLQPETVGGLITKTVTSWFKFLFRWR